MVTNNDVNYIIIQAGGRGKRMGRFCENKPKCLLPIEGQPLLFHLLNTYKNKNIIIIGDYKFDVLQKYVKLFYKNYVTFIKASESGTSAGLETALMFVPYDTPFIFTWSDLLIKNEQKFTFDKDISVGLTNDFACRWKLSSGEFKNEKTLQDGIAGFFAFKNKDKFKNIDCSKSFVRGFLTDNFKEKNSFYLQGVDEIGEDFKYEEYIKNTKCRFFNDVKIEESTVIKKCIDKNYQNLISDEITWYKYVSKYNFKNIPKLLSEDPYTISRLPGEHCFSEQIKNLDINRKENILCNYASFLNDLHSKEEVTNENGVEECKKLYLDKTISRVFEVKDLIPFFNNEYINVNGTLCKNIFHDRHISELEKYINCLYTNKFNIIHGDLTFSNSLVDEKDNVYIFDPRGSFGTSKIFGDKKYEWAKVYYSAFGNYDSINSKKFKITVSDKIEYEIESNTFEKASEILFNYTDIPRHQIKLLHALIWLSLTGYVKEDVDSVLCSFYNGLYLFENR